MKIPVNRVVAFLGPTLSATAGAVAAWLVAKANVLGIPGLDEANVATYIVAGGTFVITAGLHALGQWQWLKGHHILLSLAPVVESDGPGDADALPAVPVAVVPATPDEGDKGSV